MEAEYDKIFDMLQNIDNMTCEEIQKAHEYMDEFESTNQKYKWRIGMDGRFEVYDTRPLNSNKTLRTFRKQLHAEEFIKSMAHL